MAHKKHHEEKHHEKKEHMMHEKKAMPHKMAKAKHHKGHKKGK